MASREAPQRRPEKRKIIAELDKLLAKVNENDLVICMFSGHGTQNDTGQYFCPEDARHDDLANSCVSLNRVLNDLKSSSAKFKWLIVDACRNDPTRTASFGVQSLGKVESIPKGMTAIFSCSAGERSFEDAELNHGVFTHYLIQGLAGEAAKDGVVTIAGLYEYVHKKTRDSVKAKFKQDQVPYWNWEGTNFILRDDLLIDGVSRENRQIADRLYKQSLVHRQKEEYDNALAAITKALEIMPSYQDFLSEKQLLEQLLEFSSELKKRNKESENRKKKDENRTKAVGYATSAIELFEKEEYNKAMQAIDNALALAPNDTHFLRWKRIIEKASPPMSSSSITTTTPKRQRLREAKLPVVWNADDIPDTYPKETGPKPTLSLDDAIYVDDREQVRRHIAHETSLDVPVTTKIQNWLQTNEYFPVHMLFLAVAICILVFISPAYQDVRKKEKVIVFGFVFGVLPPCLLSSPNWWCAATCVWMTIYVTISLIIYINKMSIWSLFSITLVAVAPIITCCSNDNPLFVRSTIGYVLTFQAGTLFASEPKWDWRFFLYLIICCLTAYNNTLTF